MGTITAEVVDTGEQRDRRGRRVLPRERRLKLMEACRASGLTMAEFARREAINYTTLAGWMARAGREAAPARPVAFARVQLPPITAAQPVEVRLADGTIVRGGSPEEVAAVVRALRA